MITFTVPGAAVPCPRPRVTQNGKPYYSKRYEIFRAAVIAAFLQKFPRVYQVTGVTLSVVFVGARRNADLDNLLKSIMDALTGYLWPDDSVSTISDVQGSWLPIRRGEKAYTQITVAGKKGRDASSATSPSRL